MRLIKICNFLCFWFLDGFNKNCSVKLNKEAKNEKKYHLHEIYYQIISTFQIIIRMKNLLFLHNYFRNVENDLFNLCPILVYV